MAYKDVTQVRHTRSSSHQPVTIVSYHDHLHKSDINEVKITVLGFFPLDKRFPLGSFSLAKFGIVPLTLIQYDEFQG